jgi:sulfane dehydrogenase subunit SoxC
MNYNDYGHLDQDAKETRWVTRSDPNRSSRSLPAGQQLPGRGFYEVSGLAWSGGGAIRKVEVSTDGGKHWNDAEIRGTAHRMAHTRFSCQWNWDGKETELMSRCTDEIGQVQPSRAQVAKHWNRPWNPPYSVPGLDQHHSAVEIASDWERAQGNA